MTALFCTIEWGIETDNWDALFQTLPRSTLLQSLPYAHAMRSIHYQASRFGLILMNGEQAGLVRIGESSLFGKTIHAVTLDRGPLWFEGYGTQEHWAAFAKRFEAEFPPRILRKRRFIPETSDKTPFQKCQLIGPPYQTIWLDLAPEPDILRQNLAQKWRNILNKAERNDLKIISDWDGATLPGILQGYARDRMHKNYAGASTKFLTALSHFTIARGECLGMSCLKDDRVLAAILVFLHGRSATYQMGWTTREGRAVGAHNLLLWRAIETLRHKKILDFDLGGINDHSAAGVKAFKQGLGGHKITLIGRYE